ncbi:MAG: hypothetical protein HYU03_00635 [Thaumarchaeota archaeon]|nr:hypothetical protein [Nitrososphaerota archaeon]
MMRKVTALVIFLGIIVFSGYSYQYYASGIKNTDIVSDLWITNASDWTISNASFSIGTTHNSPLNFGSAKITSNTSVAASPTSQGYLVRVLDEIEPNQTVFVRVSNLSNQWSLESKVWDFTQPIHAAGSGDLQFNVVSRFFADTSFGRLSVASTDRFTTPSGVPIANTRSLTSSYASLAFLATLLLSFGLILKGLGLVDLRSYPFITLSIILANSWAYAFVGTGFEVSAIPDLAPFGYGKLVPFTYHASYTHITGNMPIFFLASFACETLIKVKQSFRTLLWYLLPIVGTTLASYREGFTGYLFSLSWISFGLSFLIELLAFSIWTYAIAFWRHLGSNRMNALLILSGSLSMLPLYNHLTQVLLYRPFITPYNLAISIGHLNLAMIGLAGSLLYLAYHYRKPRLAD